MRLYLVLGPQSSGTRLWTDILIRAGCVGDAGHEQRLDTRMLPGDCLVWRRNFSRADREWPDIEEMIGQPRFAGWNVQALVTMRDWHSMVSSQLAAKAEDNLEDAQVYICWVYSIIFGQLRSLRIPTVTASYEALIYDPESTAITLAHLGLIVGSLPKIEDHNARWSVPKIRVMQQMAV